MKQRINNKTDIASRNASRDRIVLSVRWKTGCPCMLCRFLVSNMFALDSHYFCSQDTELIGMTHQILSSDRTVWHCGEEYVQL